MQSQKNQGLRKTKDMWDEAEVGLPHSENDGPIDTPDQSLWAVGT